MSIKLRLFYFSIWFFCSSQVMAVEQNRAPLTCSQLGANPSLIIKFKNSSTPIQHLIETMKSSYVDFTTSEAMSGGAYVIYFKPKSSLQSQEERSGCYAKSAMDELIKEIESLPDVEHAEPNLIMSIPENNRPG